MQRRSFLGLNFHNEFKVASKCVMQLVLTHKRMENIPRWIGIHVFNWNERSFVVRFRLATSSVWSSNPRRCWGVLYCMDVDTNLCSCVLFSSSRMQISWSADLYPFEPYSASTAATCSRWAACAYMTVIEMDGFLSRWLQRHTTVNYELCMVIAMVIELLRTSSALAYATNTHRTSTGDVLSFDVLSINRTYRTKGSRTTQQSL